MKYLARTYGLNWSKPNPLRLLLSLYVVDFFIQRVHVVSGHALVCPP